MGYNLRPVNPVPAYDNPARPPDDCTAARHAPPHVDPFPLARSRLQKILPPIAQRAWRLLVAPSMMKALWLLLEVAIVAAVPSWAVARTCGDGSGEGGRPVPCACGDVLVGDRRLSPDDPITHDVCDGDGLLVRVPAGHRVPVLDLGGATIAGNGRGIGIEVYDGGDGGLTIRGPGSVRGFGIGVLANGALAALTDVSLTDNRSDGLRITGRAYTVSGCEARDNGGAGFFLRGADYRLSGNRALGNGLDGFSLGGRRASVGIEAANESSANGGNGVSVAGREHAVRNVVAMGNRGIGLHARVARSGLAPPRTRSNGRDIRISAHDSAIDLAGSARAPGDIRGARLSTTTRPPGAAP